MSDGRQNTNEQGEQQGRRRSSGLNPQALEFTTGAANSSNSSYSENHPPQRPHVRGRGLSTGQQAASGVIGRGRSRSRNNRGRHIYVPPIYPQIPVYPGMSHMAPPGLVQFPHGPQWVYPAPMQPAMQVWNSGFMPAYNGMRALGGPRPQQVHQQVHAGHEQRGRQQQEIQPETAATNAQRPQAAREGQGSNESRNRAASEASSSDEPETREERIERFRREFKAARGFESEDDDAYFPNAGQ